MFIYLEQTLIWLVNLGIISIETLEKMYGNGELKETNNIKYLITNYHHASDLSEN